MKKIIFLLVFNSGILLAADYSIDPTHTRVGFIVRHIVSKVHGEFKEFDGSFSFDAKKPENSKGKFTVKAS
ncbi:MAG: YceI family protein, partial [Deltaproteobacteria bacterium]|nr:YceI family protein [Deltaproteobacteria bacterium]